MTNDVRCPQCNKLLFKIDGLARIETRCPRCQTVVRFPIERGEAVIRIIPSRRIGPKEVKDKTQ